MQDPTSKVAGLAMQSFSQWRLSQGRTLGTVPHSGSTCGNT